MGRVTSRQHPLVRAFREAARRASPLALLDGWHLLEEATRSRLAIREVAWRDEPSLTERAALDAAAACGARLTPVSASVLDALSPVRSPSGVVALIEPRRVASGQLIPEDRAALVAVGFDIQDPGNVGVVIRAADAAGASGVALAGTSADPWGWKALRAAMGSTFRVPTWTAGDPDTACRTLAAAGLRLVATSPRATRTVYDVDLTVPTALVLGSEGAGLDPQMLARASVVVSIPMRAPVESLNVGSAAAIVLYEAARQRRVAAASPLDTLSPPSPGLADA